MLVNMPAPETPIPGSDAESKRLIQQVASALALLDYHQIDIIFPEDTLEVALIKADALQCVSLQRRANRQKK